VGASALLERKETSESGFDFKFEVTDTTSLTLSQITDDADYIGPGNGDGYWGESWIVKWELNATRRIYSNGTNRYEEPQFFYGILLDVETFCNDAHAPENWRKQNAVYNDSLPVTWLGPPTQRSGGLPYEFEHEVTFTSNRRKTFGVEFGTDFREKFPGVDSHQTFEMSLKTYVEQGVVSTYKVGYMLYDDDPTDFIVQGVGIDHTFGTYIFNSSSFFCETSHPLEHNTYDYLPPEISFPEIELDSDDDGLAPTPLDSPYVTVDIFEEGGIQDAYVWYTTDNWENLKVAYLSELPGDPGTWVANIPQQPFNTTVQWYIEAIDNKGNKATRYNTYLEPFEYTVIAQPPEPESDIPGFPLVTIVTTSLVSLIGVVLYSRKKIFKK